MNDFAIIYHWWSEKNTPVIENLADPIIFSIISVRYFNKDVPIYVIDVSQRQNNWQNYPSLLNFKVVTKPASIDKLKKNNFHPVVSRVWDINWLTDKIKENKIIFCDSDIFWIKNIFPLLGLENDPCLKNFHCGMNNGFFYYDKNSNLSKSIWNLLINIVDKCCEDVVYANDIRKTMGLPEGFFLNDERIFRSVLQSTNLFTPVSFKENNIIFAGGYNSFDYRNPTSVLDIEDSSWGSFSNLFSERFAKDCKNIHVIRSLGGNSRAKVFSIISELKNIMLSFLKFHDIKIPIDLGMKSLPYSEFRKAYALKYFYEQMEDNSCLGYKQMIKGYLVRNIKFC
jgi:hypothetical protein